jgi:DNA polymerase sigma
LDLLQAWWPYWLDHEMDQKSYHELDLLLGDAMSEIHRLEAELKARNERIEDMQQLLSRIIATAQESYSFGSKRVGRLPAAGPKEVSKEAF